MIRKLLLSFILFACWNLPQLHAQIAGGEVYYEITGPQKYKITAHIYRMCNGSAINGLSGTVYGGNYQVGMAFSRTSIQKINDTCGNPCKVQNAISTPGFERHTFVATVDFNAGSYKVFFTNNICNVKFAARSFSRLNSSTHSTSPFYLDAGAYICDTTVKQNHSPIFSMDPKFLAMCNQPMHYSPGPLDTLDMDSLGFEMAPVQYDPNASISYYTNYSPSIPLTPLCLPNITNCKPQPNAAYPRGFYFDNTVCHIAFTPSKCAEMGYIKLKVNEYRRNPITGQMVLIGYVTREFLMQVKSVVDNNPVSIGLNSPAISVCANDLMVTVKTTDVMAGPTQQKVDTTLIFWDKGYKNASFQVIDTSREKSANITLKHDTTLKKYKSQFFTVGAYDKVCNISLVSRSFIATDYPPVQHKRTSSINNCNVWNYKVTNPDTANPGNVSTTAIIYDPSSIPVFLSFQNSDTFTFNKNGRHIIQYSISNDPFKCNRVVYDTITISNAFAQGIINSGKDTTVCSSYAAKLKFQPYKSKGLISIEWFRNGTLFNTKDSVINMGILKDEHLRLKLTDNRGCHAESELTYFVKQHEALLDLPLTECKNDIASFTAIINSLKSPFTYKWNINGKDTSFSGRTLNFVLKDTTLVKLTLKDSNNCVFNDSVYAYIKPSFSFHFEQDKAEICNDSFLTITAARITAQTPYTLLWKISATDTVVEDTIITRKFAGKKTVHIKVTDANYCSLHDSLVVTPVTTPKVKMPLFVKACEGDLIEVKPTYIPNGFPKTFMWKFNNVISPVTDSTFKFNIRQQSVIWHRATNRLGCFTEDSTVIQVFPKIDVNIVSNINYNQYHKISLNTDKAFNAYQWFNNVFTRNNTFWAYELGPPGKYSIWCNVTDVNGCNGGDTIDIFTDKFVNIRDIEDGSIRIYPNPGQQELFVEVKEACLMSITGIEGKAMLEQELLPGRNLVDIRMLPTGIYIIRMDGRNFMWMKE